MRINASERGAGWATYMIVAVVIALIVLFILSWIGPHLESIFDAIGTWIKDNILNRLGFGMLLPALSIL